MANQAIIDIRKKLLSAKEGMGPAQIRQTLSAMLTELEKVSGAQQAAIADHAAPTSITVALVGQAVPVVSEAATDLDTCYADLKVLETEVGTLVVKVNAIIAAMEAHGTIAT